MIKLKFDFEKKSSSKGLMIEGFANANIFDRCRERIEPKGWELGNYKKNPVILFDHGHDMAFGSMPVGRAVNVEPQDGGLFMKALISNSKTEKITAVRDLVEEGILKTFSVGFNPLEDVKRIGDDIVIPKAELIECSIVPVPMNQDSTFSVSTRSFKSEVASEWFNHYAKSWALYKKGARHAAIIANEIRKQGKDFASLVEMFKGIFSEDQLMSYLDGTVLELDKPTLEAFSKALNIDQSYFDSLSVKAEGEQKPDETEDQEGEQQQNDQENGDSENGDNADSENEEMPMEMTEQDKEAYIAECMSFAEDEASRPSWASNEEAWKKARGCASKSYSKEDPERYLAVTTWLYLNKFDGTIAKSESGEKSGVSQSEKNTMPTGDTAVPPDQNPYLEAAKQTNVLLGTLINEVQKMNSKMEKMVEPNEPPEQTEEQQESETMPPSSENDAKNLIANIRKTHEDLRKRIQRL